MEATLYVNTTSKVIRAAVTGTAIPSVPIKLQTHLKLTVYFHETGEDPALLDSPTFNVTLKALADAGGDLFAQKIAATATGADYYEFEWDKISNAALLAAIGNSVDGLAAVLTIGWTVDDVAEKADIRVTIANSWQRDADVLPDDEDAIELAFDERAVRFDKAQSLSGTQIGRALMNLGITNIRSATITASGYLEMTNNAGDTFNIGLNTGSAPA